MGSVGEYLPDTARSTLWDLWVSTYRTLWEAPCGICGWVLTGHCEKHPVGSVGEYLPDTWPCCSGSTLWDLWVSTYRTHGPAALEAPCGICGWVLTGHMALLLWKHPAPSLRTQQADCRISLSYSVSSLCMFSSYQRKRAYTAVYGPICQARNLVLVVSQGIVDIGHNPEF